MVGHGKNRENTGDLKIKFEWVPCLVEYRLYFRGCVALPAQVCGVCASVDGQHKLGDCRQCNSPFRSYHRTPTHVLVLLRHRLTA